MQAGVRGNMITIRTSSTTLFEISKHRGKRGAVWHIVHAQAGVTGLPFFSLTGGNLPAKYGEGTDNLILERWWQWGKVWQFLSRVERRWWFPVVLITAIFS